MPEPEPEPEQKAADEALPEQEKAVPEAAEQTKSDEVEVSAKRMQLCTYARDLMLT